jgi:hypothetical protein
VRRILSTLLDYRDWVSYVYVPIIIPLLFLTPYHLVVSYYKHLRHVNALIEVLSQGSADLAVISRLLDSPIPLWAGESAEEVPELGTRSFQEFEIRPSRWLTQQCRMANRPVSSRSKCPGPQAPGARSLLSMSLAPRFIQLATYFSRISHLFIPVSAVLY